MNGIFDPTKYQQVQQVSESYTKKPNLIFDEVMAQVGGNAYKCLDVIVRCTYGYHNNDAQISESSLIKMTGIKRKETIRAAILELEQIGIIEVTRKNGATNLYRVTPDQYGKSVPVLKNTSTENPSHTSTEKCVRTSTENPSPIKENKENYKEIISSNSARENFEVQQNVLSGFVKYFPSDHKYYSLESLCDHYEVQIHFTAQAQASYPHVGIDALSSMWVAMGQWSLTKEIKKTAQQWMNTWLNWIKNDAYKFEQKSVSQSKPVYQSASDKRSQKAKEFDDFFASHGQPSLQERDVTPINLIGEDQ